MRPLRPLLGWIALAACSIGMILHGPIPQWPDYHAFADRREWLGVPNAADVLTNLAFAFVAILGVAMARPVQAPTPAECTATRAFVACLALIAAGSGYYHLAPDDTRLAYDRLPIALACASLLCAFHGRYAGVQGRAILPAMSAIAAASVAWWSLTQARDAGDLRPYLLLQAAPLFLVPIWQWAFRVPGRERRRYGLAIALYVLAKACELQDHRLLDLTGVLSGHSAKHLLAASAAAIILSILLSPRPTLAAARSRPAPMGIGRLQ